MNHCYIKAISYYLPEKILANSDIKTLHPDWNVDEMEQYTGVKTRYIAADDEYASDMAEKAARKLFVEHSINPDEIDFLILCTQTTDYIAPATACVLQNKLGLSKNIGAFDFNLGCTGFVYGLSIAKGLVESNSAKNVLLITSENISKYIHPLDKSTLFLFGDAAAATLISKRAEEGSESIGNFSFGTDGTGVEKIFLKYGSPRNPLTKAKMEDSTDKFGNILNDTKFYMNGPSVFSFSINTAPKHIRDILLKENVTVDDIDFYILHQANKLILDTIRKKLGVPEEKFIINIDRYGNTVASSIPIALCDSINEKVLKKGNKILLSAFGVGYSWASVIITY
jgi:3-oxoacyl-[acyl-carrier-protein] synthase III